MNVDPKIEQLAVNTIRFLAVDAVEKANSGHPGMPSGAADYAYVLWTKYLKYNPAVPDWQDRDRFVLSAGHGSMLLYALLHLAGYGLPMDQLKNFRQWGSMTPGHPERGCAPGVEVTTGPLGQGFGNGVGMAIAAKMMAARFNKPGYDVIDHYVYAICSDGDLMEGISHEAASIAGRLGLGNIVYIYDDNHISIEGDTEITYSDDVEERFEGYGWHVQRIYGHDRKAADLAIAAARAEDRRPSLMNRPDAYRLRRPAQAGHKGSAWQPLGAQEVEAMKLNLGWPLEPTFLVPDEVYDLFAQRRAELEEVYGAWTAMFERYRLDWPEEAKLWDQMMQRAVPPDITQRLLAVVDINKEEATRDSSSQVMQEIVKLVPSFCGGSADLWPSTKTYLKGWPDIAKDHFEGRNFHFGIREHGMGDNVHGPGCKRWVDPVRVNISYIFGLHAPYPAACIDAAPAGDLRLHARQHISGRGRPDPRADRAACLDPRDTGGELDQARGCSRDRRRLGCGAGDQPRTYCLRPDSPEGAAYPASEPEQRDRFGPGRVCDIGPQWQD